ncbi:MAG: hypothetical protein RR733_04435 [Victivallaceae bacterium]
MSLYEEEECRALRRQFFIKRLKINLSLVAIGCCLFFSPVSLGYTSVYHIVIDKTLGFLLVLCSCCSCFSSKFDIFSSLIGCFILYSSTIEYNPTVFANSSLLGFMMLAIRYTSYSRPYELDIGPTIPDNLSYNPSCFGRRCVESYFSLIVLIITRYSIGIYSGSFLSWIFTLSCLSLILNVSGSKRRWHVRPLIVFSTFTITLSLSILLAVASVIYGSYLFLIASFFALLSSTLEIDEMRASLNYIYIRKKEEESISLSLVGKIISGSEFYRKSILWEEQNHESFSRHIKHTFQGVSCPLNLILVLVTGIILNLFSNQFIMKPGFQTFISIIGIVVTIFTSLSFSEHLRFIRFFNLIPAFLLIISPAIFHIFPRSNDFLYVLSTGLIIFICSLRGGMTKEAE